ncbi:MAG: DUF3971 domain-containing protein [Gammaproteobacteria bacterium]|nr:DUF3971 domain-containing protein [Gammaproteobacteria bacterium]
MLVAGAGGGYFDLNDDGFEVGFPGAYDSIWIFDSGRGRIAFDLTRGYPVLSSELVRVTNGDMTASGRLQIKLPEARVDRTWGLELGVVDANLLESGRYIPNAVDPGVREWTDRTILGGRSLHAGMVFHGTLDKVAPRASKTFELFFDVEKTVLEYDPAWPPVEDMAANIYISNRGIFSDGVTGRILDSTFTADVDVPMALDDPPDTVGIEGRAEGALEDGLRVLQETPLADATGQPRAPGGGPATTRERYPSMCQLVRAAGEGVAASASIDLDGNSIEMGGLNLAIDNIETTLRFETAAGLSATDFKASLLGYPVEGSIESDATPMGGAVNVSFAGEVDVARLLEWSGQRLSRAAQGRFDYDAVLHVPFGDRATELAYVEATSNLEGVALDLPPPMGKGKTESRDFRYRQSFIDDGFRIDLNLADSTRASLKSVDEQIVGGRVHFGESHPGVTTYDDLEVTGALDFVDYSRWNEVSRYLQTPGGRALEMADILDTVEIDINELRAFGVDLENVRTQIMRETGVWHINLSNVMLDGTILVSDADVPIDISLEYLRLPADDQEGDDADPLGDIDPVEFTDIDFRTAELKVGDEDYGHWRFDFRPGHGSAPQKPVSRGSWADADGHLASRMGYVWRSATQPLQR